MHVTHSYLEGSRDGRSWGSDDSTPPTKTNKAVTITAEMFIRMSIDVANFFFGAKSYFLNLNQVSGKMLEYGILHHIISMLTPSLAILTSFDTPHPQFSRKSKPRRLCDIFKHTM